MQFECRFYKNAFPETEDPVMVKVTQIEEMGVHVNLLEYNNRPGMILLTEVTRRRIRSINKLVRVGRNEVALVVRVDREKGYIDLSKRRVLSEDLNQCEEKFARGIIVRSILHRTAEMLGFQTHAEFEELYEKTAWFYDKKYNRPGAAYDVFFRAVSNDHELDGCQVDENTRTILLNNIRRRLAPQAVKCRADVDVACYGYDGIDAVKAALREGLSVSTEEMPVKINLIAPPLYVVTTTCLDGNEGIGVLQKAIKKIEEGIGRYQGIYKTGMEPKVVTQKDEDQLQGLLEEVKRETIEKSGDSDGSADGGIRGRLPGEEDNEEASSAIAALNNQASQRTEIDTDDDDDEDKDE